MQSQIDLSFSNAFSMKTITDRKWTASASFLVSGDLTNPETLQHRPLTHGTILRSQNATVRAAHLCVPLVGRVALADAGQTQSQERSFFTAPSSAHQAWPMEWRSGCVTLAIPSTKAPFGAGSIVRSPAIKLKSSCGMHVERRKKHVRYNKPTGIQQESALKYLTWQSSSSPSWIEMINFLFFSLHSSCIAWTIFSESSFHSAVAIQQSWPSDKISKLKFHLWLPKESFQEETSKASLSWSPNQLQRKLMSKPNLDSSRPFEMFSFCISCWGLCEITQPYPSCEDKKHAQTHVKNPPLARSWSHWPPQIWGNQLLTRSNSGESAFFWHQWSIIGCKFISSAISTKKYNRNAGSLSVGEAK